MSYMNSINDYESNTPEFVTFRYKTHKNSVVVLVRFRGPFVLYKLNHGRLHAFLFMLFRHDHYHNHSHNLLLLKPLGY